ncbi:MAG: hypothetical protein ACERKV_13830, partial [Clostridiaceae bacterium]
MSLRFIYGRAGSGKSYFCYNDIDEKLKQGKKVIILVPEQFSFQTQRNIINVLGEKKANCIEILDFKKLAQKVFKEVGGINRKYLDKS